MKIYINKQVEVKLEVESLQLGAETWLCVVSDQDHQQEILCNSNFESITRDGFLASYWRPLMSAYLLVSKHAIQLLHQQGMSQWILFKKKKKNGPSTLILKVLSGAQGIPDSNWKLDTDAMATVDVFFANGSYFMEAGRILLQKRDTTHPLWQSARINLKGDDDDVRALRVSILFDCKMGSMFVERLSLVVVDDDEDEAGGAVVSRNLILATDAITSAAGPIISSACLIQVACQGSVVVDRLPWLASFMAVWLRPIRVGVSTTSAVAAASLNGFRESFPLVRFDDDDDDDNDKCLYVWELDYRSGWIPLPDDVESIIKQLAPRRALVIGYQGIVVESGISRSNATTSTTLSGALEVAFRIWQLGRSRLIDEVFYLGFVGGAPAMVDLQQFNRADSRQLSVVIREVQE